MTICNATEGCTRPAEYSYTWPGKDECFACIECAKIARNVARAIGLHLQIKLWPPNNGNWRPARNLEG